MILQLSRRVCAAQTFAPRLEAEQQSLGINNNNNNNLLHVGHIVEAFEGTDAIIKQQAVKLGLFDENQLQNNIQRSPQTGEF